MKDLVVIIPLHEFNKEVDSQLKKAIKSVPNEVEIIISCPQTLENDIKTATKKNKNVKVLGGQTDAPTDFCSLVNFGVENSDSKWFSDF